MKKNKLIGVGVGLSVLSLIGIGIATLDTSTLSLKDNKSDLIWSFDKDYSMNDKEFKLYLNNEVVLTTKDYKAENYKKVDLVAPQKVSNYKKEYNENGVIISWDEITDKGTLNNYVIEVINGKDKLLKKSNVLQQEYISGLKTFKTYLNEKEFIDTLETSVEFKKEDLIEGINTIKVEAIDNEDNKISSSYDFLYYKLDNKIENNILSPVNNDTSQSYNYSFEIEGDDNKYEFKEGLDIAELFKDKKAPSKPKAVYSIKNNKTLCLDLSSSDIGSEYSYKISGVGEVSNNKVFSEKLTYSNKSELKGYYYYFGDSSDHKVTDKDTFTDKKYIEIPNLEYKTYYLHIVAVDNAGNISETATHKIENKKPVVVETQKPSSSQSSTSTSKPSTNTSTSTPTTNTSKPSTSTPSTNSQSSLPSDEKMNLINAMCSKTSTVSSSQYNTRLKHIYNYIPTKVLRDVKDDGLKIKFISGNLRQYLLNNLGYQTGMEIWGIYRARSVEIYVTTLSDTKTTLHEIGHAWDYTNKGYTKSYLNDFYHIYNEEKNQMFGASNYFAKSETEYFAECFATYLLNPSTLKSKAPKTYEYFRQNL